MKGRFSFLVLVLGFVLNQQYGLAQEAFRPFTPQNNDRQERRLELIQYLLSQKAWSESDIKKAQFNNLESKDHKLRITQVSGNNQPSGSILFEWMSEFGCITQIISGEEWIGKPLEIEALKDNKHQLYLMHTLKNQEGIELHGIVLLELSDKRVETKSISISDAQNQNEMDRPYLSWTYDPMQSLKDSFYLIDNGFHFIRNEGCAIAVLTKTKSSDFIYQDNSFAENVGSIEVSFYPPVDSIPAELVSEKNVWIGKELIRVKIKRSLFVAGDYYAPEVYTNISAVYTIKGKELSSTFYESYFEDQAGETESEDKVWGKYALLKPDYIQLADGSLVFRTFQLSNEFRSGMCGSCDYLNEDFIQIKGKQYYPLLNCSFNLGTGGGTYSLYQGNNKQAEHSFFKTEGQPYMHSLSLNMGTKGWKIYFSHQENENTSIGFYDVQIKAGKGCAVVKINSQSPIQLPKSK